MIRRAVCCALLIGAARAGQAQCPDGTPPPCAHTGPVLDENRWIVVPFQNISRAPDAEWLGAASVNLLYLNLSQWHDLRVVDDERVADLLRGRSPASVGLSDALALARRAGAGSVVMGDLLKTGNQFTVTGKVYRVRNGQRIRQFTVQLASADSVLPAYRTLAAGLLDLPGSGQAGGIGTARLDAFREYARGVTALRAWDLDTARAAFERAIAADTTFALARYQLSRTFGWITGHDSEATRQIQRAAQLAGGLAPRERELINGYFLFITGQVEEARALYRSMLTRDTLDAEAWYSMGETEYHDNLVVRDAAGHAAFRGSWNAAIADFTRAFDLDPAYHLAFGHVADIYGSTVRFGCDQLRSGMHYCGRYYWEAIARLDHDTIVTVPLNVATTTEDEADAAMLAQAQSGLVRHNLLAARDAAGRWVQSGPREPDAHYAYAVALLRTGDADGAAREYAALGGAVPRRAGTRDLLRLTTEIALKQGHYADAYRRADSLFAMPRAGDGGDPANGVNALLGRFNRWDQHGYAAWEPERQRGFGISTRAVAGFLVPGYDTVEAAFLRLRASEDSTFHVTNASQKLMALAYTAVFSLRFRPTSDLPADTSTKLSVVNTASALILRDTAAARRFATIQESAPDEGDFGPSLVMLQAAETFLMIGDTTRARADLSRLETEFWPGEPLDGGESGSYSVRPAMWGRVFLLQGDLAAAQHDRATMIRAFQRVVGLWSTGDAEVQPAVARARAALASAGASP